MLNRTKEEKGISKEEKEVAGYRFGSLFYNRRLAGDRNLGCGG